MELTELEKKIKGSGRKLLSESITGEEEDNLEEVEEMLSALGDGESVPDNLDALERLHACVSVERLQPTLYEKLGLKKPIGTMGKLVKEIQTAYPKENRAVEGEVEERWRRRGEDCEESDEYSNGSDGLASIRF